MYGETIDVQAWAARREAGTWQGWLYVDFVIDVFARLIHHSDRGSQYLIDRRAPWKTKESVELATLEWVAWVNNHHLLEPFGYIPPAEAEANHYRHLASQAASVVA